MEIQKIFSEINTDEKLYSVLLSEDELALFSEAIEGKKTISKSDKAAIWANKHLVSKKDNEAIIEAYDQEGPRDSHKLGVQLAKTSAGGAAAGLGVLAGIKAKEHSKDLKKLAKVLQRAPKSKMAREVSKKALKNIGKQSLIPAAIGVGGTAALAGGEYLGTRAGRYLGKKLEDKNEKIARNAQKNADLSKVALGRMTEEEFASKYGK